MWNLTQSQPQVVQPRLPRLNVVCGDSTCGILLNPNPRLRNLDSLGCMWCVVTAHEGSCSMKPKDYESLG